MFLDRAKWTPKNKRGAFHMVLLCQKQLSYENTHTHEKHTHSLTHASAGQQLRESSAVYKPRPCNKGTSSTRRPWSGLLETDRHRASPLAKLAPLYSSAQQTQHPLLPDID